ncbi:MAG: DUF3552 domain-containing protein, partial [Muribaculaceae bacterium]|nr:DUF3552 domain-containing protein [Muribaculaceae bacterium]
MNVLDIFMVFIAVAIAFGAGAIITRVVMKRNAKSAANEILEKARLEAEVLKNNEVIKGKEAGMSIKSDAEKEANSRLSKVQQSEAKLKQREMQINQLQGDVQRKRNEVDALKAGIDKQTIALEERKKEVDRMERSVRDTLEHVSGLSAEEAKEKLVESLKDEAKTSAASYINDIMDD